MKQNPESPSRRYRIGQALTWPVMKLCGLSCRHFAELCTARMDRDLSIGEKARFRMHNLLCGLCRPLPKQFETLQKVTREASHSEPESIPEESLEPEARKRILQAINAKATNGHPNG